MSSERTIDNGKKAAQKAQETVVRFPNDLPEQATQDRLYNALFFLFPQNKIVTSGLPQNFAPAEGAQIVQMAAIQRSENVSDVFVMLRIPDDTQEKAYRERMLPMNGFTPQAAEKYVQSFASRSESLPVAPRIASSEDRIAALELRGVLYINL